MIKNYTHIIWDWNGTLFNDVELCADVFNKLLKKYSLTPLSIMEYREIFTFPVKDYYEKAGLDFNLYPFEELGREWMNDYEHRKHTCSLFGDTIEILEYIRINNIEQSILSAYPIKTLAGIVKLMKIDFYFKYIYGLDHIYATGKTELGFELMQKIKPEGKVLFIGDTVHDYEVAQAIGADCVLVANGHQSKLKLLDTGAMVIDELIELKK